MEGASATRGFRNHYKNAFERLIIEYVRGGYPHYPDAAFGKPTIAALVMTKLAGKIVMGAVNLDRELCGRTVEVQNIWLYRVLPSEPKSIQPPSAQAILQ